MKRKNTFWPAILAMLFAGLFLPRLLRAQDDQDRIVRDAKDAKAAFLKADPSMQNLFEHAAGYAIFPNVGKGAAGVGGAAGKGAVYQKGALIGTAQMVQVTVGAQAGGQASAIAVKTGAATNGNYRNGVVVFSQEKGGLMLEASLGGQKFTYKPLK